MTTKSTGKWVVFGIAFAVACLIWYMVISNDGPRVTISLGSLPVTLKNGESLHENGLAYYVDEGGSVGVTVTVLQTKGWLVSSEDIRLTADLSGVEGDTAKVGIKAEVMDNQSVIGNNYKLQNNHMVIHTEPLKKKKIPVIIHTKGEPEDNCSVGSPIPDNEYVSVRVPVSIVDKVESAEATVDVSGRSAGFQDEAKLDFLDEKGSVIDCQSSQIIPDTDTMSVFIPIGTEKEITIHLPGEEHFGKEGYRCTDITADRETVSVIGPEESIKNFREIAIGVRELEQESMTEGFEQILDLRQYLPEDVLLMDREDESLRVHVEIQKLIRKKYTFPSSELELIHPEPDYTISVKTEKIVVELEALEAELESLNADSIAVTADLAGFSEGIYQVPVEIRLNGVESEKRYRLIDAGTVKIEIKKTEAETES